MKIYNKLVRDKILKILKKAGVKHKYHIADDAEYYTKLHDKLQEEIQEFVENPCMEEFADILEVLEAIGKYHKLDFGEIKTIKGIKQIERGAFYNKIILESTD